MSLQAANAGQIGSAPGRRLAACAAAAALLGLGACERKPTYGSAGERLDAAIRRVEELKHELREAEQELQAARAALGEKVEQAPEDAGDVPAPPPDS